MISAKFSPPVEVYSDSSWGDDLRASTGSVWLPQSALLVTFLRPQKQVLSLPALRQKCTRIMVKGFSEFSLASFRPCVNGYRKPGKQGTDSHSRVVRRAQGTPGSEAAHHSSNRREPTAHCTCTGFEVVTTVPGLGWTSQQLEACHISASGDWTVSGSSALYRAYLLQGWRLYSGPASCWLPRLFLGHDCS